MENIKVIGDNMDKRKILISLVVFVVAAGVSVVSVSAVSAAKKTVNFKENQVVNIKLGNGDSLGVFWQGPYNANQYSPNTIEISIWAGNYYPKHYKITKSDIKYVKRVNGINKYMIKSYNLNNKYVSTTNRKFSSTVGTQVPSGWKPYKTTVYYTSIKSQGSLETWKFDSGTKKFPEVSFKYV